MPKIVIAAGGTGGHVFPALCVADELQQRGCEIIFITDQRGKKYIKSEAIVYKILNKNRFYLYISILLNFIKIFFRFLIKRPDCVIGFGGYPSVAPVLAAQVLRIKNFIHEQNAIAGQANKLLAKFATAVFTSFPKTSGLANGLCVGNPTRFEKIYPNIPAQPTNARFTILIFGGSQGAGIFADAVTPAICALKIPLKIYQQARESDIPRIKNSYENAGIESVVAPFFDDIASLYLEANLVISRAGASSVFEAIGFAKPLILLPYEASRSGDQMANARYLLGHRAARVITSDPKSKIFDFENLSVTEILRRRLDFCLNETIMHPEILAELSRNIAKLKIANPTKSFVDNITSIYL